MKNCYLKKSAFVSVIFLMIIMMYGCPSKEITKAPEQKTELQKVAELPKLAWLVDNDIYIDTGDPIRFYNEYAIIAQGKIPIKIKSYHDGKFSIKDSSINFNYSIPADTKGELIKVEHKLGKPSAFIIRFDHSLQNENENGNLEEQDSTAYDHIFELQTNKEFSISLHPKIITIAGEKKSVDLGLHGNGSKKCRVMYKSENPNTESTIGAPASGVPDVIGTKIIK